MAIDRISNRQTKLRAFRLCHTLIKLFVPHEDVLTWFIHMGIID